MKKIMSLIVALAMVLCMSASAFAYNSEEQLMNLDAEIALSSEELAEQQQIDEWLRKQSTNIFFPNGRVDRITYRVNITPCQQSKSYYCGPACTKMAYEGITGDSSHDQSWFADKLGTEQSGATYSGDIATFLKNYTGRSYSLANMKLQTEEDFFNNVKQSLKIGCPVVGNVKSIPGRGYSSTSGHFILIYGMEWDSYYGCDTAYYSYVDPHYNSKYYGIYYASNSSMFAAENTNGGNYIRAI